MKVPAVKAAGPTAEEKTLSRILGFSAGVNQALSVMLGGIAAEMRRNGERSLSLLSCGEDAGRNFSWTEHVIEVARSYPAVLGCANTFAYTVADAALVAAHGFRLRWDGSQIVMELVAEV